MVQIALLLLPILVARDAPQFAASVEIASSGGLGRANRLVLGGNLVSYQEGGYGDTSPQSTNTGQGMWDPVAKAPVAGMVARAKAAGIKIARWPGGCAAHLYQWKRTIGPVGSRPNQRFGLPEFLTVCKAIGAQPLITLSDYAGTAQDAADFVEYLNSPADAAHPWAMRRAQDGHPKPVGAVWFEYGNESEHGPHKSNDDIGKVKPFTAAEYAAKFLEARARIRAVDPKVRLGAVISTGFPELDGWPSHVAKALGPNLDFAIHHSYIPGMWGARPELKTDSVFQHAWAAPDQIQRYYDKLNALLKSTTKRSSVPIAVTEFNGGFVQEEPVPYRHTLGNALLIAEMLRVFLEPKNNVAFANFWVFPNEYWGMVRGYSAPFVERPQFFPASLYASYLRDEILGVKVACPTYDVAGDSGMGIEPHRGLGAEFGFRGPAIPVEGSWTLMESTGMRHSQSGGTLEVEFDGSQDLNYFYARKTVPLVTKGTLRLTGWVRTEALTTTNGASFQIGDSRGWLATKSAMVTPSVVGTKPWTQVSVDYDPLPDTKELEVVARRLADAGVVSGKAWYRDVSIRPIRRASLAGVPLVSAFASRDKSGTSVFLVNKSLEAEAKVTVALGGKGGKAVLHLLSGPKAESTNETNPKAVRVTTQSLGKVGGKFLVRIPAHSMGVVVVSQG